ncbi:hypothetical protein PALA14_04163 [Pseudomonas aeruginosa]|nr:hypothetical protein PALA14_04163 [Pseudomonas aeruginosa]
MELAALIGRLNPDCRRALERAAQRCLQRTHHYVEIEHLLLELLDIDGGDFACLLPRFGLERDALVAEINLSLELFKAGNTRTPALSAHTIGLLEDAVVHASVLGQAQIRSGLLLLALLDREERRALLLNSASSLLRIPHEALQANLLEWIQASREQPAAPNRPAAGGDKPESAQDPLLDQYTQDLTAEARAGRIDPIVGRDGEIRQCVDILLRRRQNNPILVGAPGVGKTAVVEGLALRIAAGEVPPSLQEVILRVLDLGLLQAGASMKGEFEQRLKGVIDAVRNSAQPIILFIDEAHTLIGAGGAEGGSDAANLLKPALARGELRTLAATTWLEYKKYFEKDPALTRRFQLVQVEEPDEATAVEMLRGVAGKLELHHGVQIMDAAIVDAVKLSHRYISGRQLPDKAISVLDTACARVALGQHDVPPPLESLRHREQALEEELQRLRREQATGLDHSARITALESESGDNRRTIRELETRWDEEREAVRELLDTRRELLALSESADAAKPDEELDGRIDHLAAELARLAAGLEAIRQDDPLVPEQVDSRTVAAVIAGWTGIPVGKMLADEAHAIRSLAQRMGQRVMGQEAALGAIAQRIQAYRAGLSDPAKPVGVFLLPGPTGVGKTETAYALADALYGGERNLISINLSEYQEAHTVSQLKGAPPRLRRLRQRRRAHRSGAPQALFGGAAGRDRESPSGRAGSLLQRVRQGRDGRRHRPGGGLQEHRDPRHQQRRRRTAAGQPGRTGRHPGLRRAPAQSPAANLPPGVPRAHDRGALPAAGGSHPGRHRRGQAGKTAGTLQGRYRQTVRLRPGHRQGRARQVQRGGRAGYRERADGAGDGEVGGVGVGVGPYLRSLYELFIRAIHKRRKQ